MMDDQLGRVQAGFTADLLLVDGDPLHDISLLTRPQEQLRLIMKGGRVVKNTLAQPKGG
jgi:imidazolonepropionase-like amidohydrolase